MNGFVGIPFVDGGRDEAGCDCWGLVRLYLRRTFFLDLPAYGETPAADLAGVQGAVGAAIAAGTWRPVKRPEARDGDVVLMGGIERVDGRPVRTTGRHVGVMVEPTRMLHVEHGTDSVIVRLSDVSVRHRIESFWRHAALC